MGFVVKCSKARSICMVSMAFALTVLLVRYEVFEDEMLFSKRNTTMIKTRKHLKRPTSGSGVDVEDMNRIGKACSKEDIAIYTGEAAPLPSGIPSYAVQIMNKCSNDCSIANIRLHCGWFSSARLINPRLFRRLRYDDCLVNDGRPLPPATAISFQYANTFRYPLTVASLVCL
ncbi:hypothetical protein HN51_002867 [Arachis hypogaea]|nr:TPD1 protein homolog 1 [Arachis duranensis]XP_025613425.1 TPD1 protein homolog 1 [Arachis hypogaea]